MENEIVLQLDNVKVAFHSRSHEINAVNGVSFSVRQGEVLGIVGESGSGKSVTMNTAMRMLPSNAKMKEGSIHFCGKDISNATEKEMSAIRGNEISMVFQDPISSLDPLYTIGNQLDEVLKRHKNLTKAQRTEAAADMLRKVGINDPEQRLKQYPHELSGGMRQRVVIAMALLCEPKLLIADEPTTALDVTIQAQIIELIRNIHKSLNNTVIFITHNLGIISEICDRVVVMYAGKIVESGSIEDIFINAGHPYTTGLLRCVPSLSGERKSDLTPIEGNPIDLRHLPSGCAFAPRCTNCMNICLRKQPPSFSVSKSHSYSCWLGAIKKDSSVNIDEEVRDE